MIRINLTILVLLSFLSLNINQIFHVHDHHKSTQVSYDQDLDCEVCDFLKNSDQNFLLSELEDFKFSKSYSSKSNNSSKEIITHLISKIGRGPPSQLS